MNKDTIDQFDEQDVEKDTINQFDEQAIEKSKFFNKRTLIIGTLIGISVPVAFFLSLDYFAKNTPAIQSYQYVLAEHLKVNKLNNPKGKTKQENKTKQAGKTKQADKIEQAGKTKQADKIEQAGKTKQPYKIKQAGKTKQADKTKQLNKTKQANKALATAATANPKNSHKNSPKNTTETTTLKTKTNKTHQNNQAQIQGLYNKTQTALNSLLESQKRHKATQEKHRNEIALKVDQLQENTKRTINQFIKKMSALFNQQATKTVKPEPKPKDRARAKVNPNPNPNPNPKPNPLKQTNTTVFELIDISLWDSRPQATIRYQGKTSIVDVNSIRLGWKIINIDFDKEQITIENAKNGQQIILEKIR